MPTPNKCNACCAYSWLGLPRLRGRKLSNSLIFLDVDQCIEVRSKPAKVQASTQVWFRRLNCPCCPIGGLIQDFEQAGIGGQVLPNTQRQQILLLPLSKGASFFEGLLDICMVDMYGFCDWSANTQG